MRVIGRKDMIDLPDLGLSDIEAKIDTGAYGCALHCHKMEVIQKDGEDVLSFEVLDPHHPEFEGTTFYSKKFNEKIVKNSGGQSENRFTIQSQLVIFNESYDVEFSLTDRKNMKYPVLIGRKFLAGKFIVDVKQKDISFKEKSQK